MTDSILSFGTANVSQGRIFFRGPWSSVVSYNTNDAVSFGGSSYIAIAGSLNVSPTVTTSWSVMCSAGGVSSVAGHVGAVTLVGADISDHDAALGVPLLDASGFIKAAQLTTNVNAQVGTTYTILSGDRGKLVTLTNASAVAVTVPQATGSFAAGFFCEVTNLGAGVCTFTPVTSLIDGAASLTLKQFQSITLTSVGGNWVCLRSKPTAITGADLPNPSSSTLGGVQSIAAVSHNFLTSISTSGVPALAQPSAADLSNGTTGTAGTAVVLATSPSITNAALTTPAIQSAGASFVGSTSGSTTVKASAVAGFTTLTLPAATDTLIGKATTDTLTNKSYDTAGTGNVFKVGGIDVTTAADTSFTPTLSADIGTITTASATLRFKRVGKLVFLSVVVNITTAGTALGHYVQVTLPFTSGAAEQYISGREANTTGKSLWGQIVGGTSQMIIGFYDNTASVQSGYRHVLTGTYEIA